ncbi:hypothetical protein [Sorangium sp. So ce861]
MRTVQFLTVRWVRILFDEELDRLLPLPPVGVNGSFAPPRPGVQRV